MIVFAAITPHSPLIVPSIGKTHRKKMAGTLKALEEIEQALYAAKPDTICIIAPHAIRYTDAYSVNLAEKYIGTFKNFGDFSTTVEAQPDFLMIDHIQRTLRDSDCPITLTSNIEIDYGFSVPILSLTSHLKRWKLIPVTPSMHDGKSHYEFGSLLKNVLHAETGRVAVIASADLSHKVSEESAGGPTPDGMVFDRSVIDATSQNNAEPMLALSPDIIETVAQCGYRPIMTLLGTLHDMKVTPTQLCYETPFGVGYLTVRYDVA